MEITTLQKLVGLAHLAQVLHLIINFQMSMDFILISHTKLDISKTLKK